MTTSEMADKLDNVRSSVGALRGLLEDSGEPYHTSVLTSVVDHLAEEVETLTEVVRALVEAQ